MVAVHHAPGETSLPPFFPDKAAAAYDLAILCCATADHAEMTKVRGGDIFQREFDVLARAFAQAVSFRGQNG